ncbi:MAG: hypothetical protein KDC37_00650, partial [Flavobacteriales bacterium]|nr:hypothetical protein [Flavobacteriales bacterium]
GFGVYQVTRNKVLGQGKAIEYVHVQDWWFIDTYYRNGEKISESVYEKEMEDFEKNGVVIARQLKKTNALNDGSEDS